MANASPVDNGARLEIGGVLQPIDSVDLSGQEADLNISLNLDSTIGLQDAGGVARYRVSIANNTDQPAYDLHVFVDIADQQTLLGNTTFDAGSSTSTRSQIASASQIQPPAASSQAHRIAISTARFFH